MIDVRLFEQCAAVYNAMEQQAEHRSFDEDAPATLKGRTLAVYQGFTTYLIESLGMTISNYTPVMRRLQAMDCLYQVQRGGRGIPSEWALLKPPSERDFSRSTNWRVPDRERLSQLEERVEELERRLALPDAS